MWGAIGRGISWARENLGGIASSAMGYLGARGQRKWQAGQATLNRNFQERMRNTQWQAGVADMEAAGLNPALAYQQGGASSPGGSMASSSADTASSAMQMLQQRKTLKLLDAQIEKTGYEAKTARGTAETTTARSGYLTRTFSANGTRSSPLIHDLVDSELSNATAGATNTAALARRNNALADIAGPMAKLSGTLGQWLPIAAGMMGSAGPASNLIRAVRARRTLGSRNIRSGATSLGKRFAQTLRRRRR